MPLGEYMCIWRQGAGPGRRAGGAGRGKGSRTTEDAGVGSRSCPPRLR